MNTTTPAIEVKDLKFAYQTPLVVDIADLSIGRGERVFLYGPSGSGKTTLLGILAGLLEVLSGNVRLLGQDFGEMGGRARDHFRGIHIGYIFQMFNLIPYLSVVENIVLPCRVNPARAHRAGGASGTGQLDIEARRLCEELGIGAIVDRRVTDLSVGQQQRVAAARALIGAPEIIIADEPTSALDMDHREQFLRLLFKEADRSKSAVVFVSHDQSLKHLFPRSISLQDINRAHASAGSGAAQ